MSKLFIKIALVVLFGIFSPLRAQWGASSGSTFYWYRNGGTPTTDTLRFIPGSNVTITQSGYTVTIAASGGAFVWASQDPDSGGWLSNRSLDISAAAWIGTTANGATDAVVSYVPVKNFDTATAETLTVDFVLPTYWSSIDSVQIDCGTSDTAGDSAQFALLWRGIADGGVVAGAFSSAVTAVRDFGATAHVRKVLSFTSAITGTGLAANARVIWKLYRDVSVGNDIAADVYLRGVRFFGKGIK